MFGAPAKDPSAPIGATQGTALTCDSCDSLRLKILLGDRYLSHLRDLRDFVTQWLNSFDPHKHWTVSPPRHGDAKNNTDGHGYSCRILRPKTQTSEPKTQFSASSAASCKIFVCLKLGIGWMLRAAQQDSIGNIGARPAPWPTAGAPITNNQ